MEKLYRQIARKTEQLNKLNDEIKELKFNLMQSMKDESIDCYMFSKGSVTYIPKSVSYTFDVAKFKKDEVDLYEKYMTKERVVSEQVRISERKS